MITVESLIYSLYFRSGLINNSNVMSEWEINFVASVVGRIGMDRALSTKQADICLRILEKYAQHIADNQTSVDDIRRFLENPVYKKEPVTTKYIPKEVVYIGNQTLLFRTNYKPSINDDIRKFEKGYFKEPLYNFDPKHKIWVVKVSNNNLHKIIDFISKHEFSFDDDVVEFLKNCADANDYPVSDLEYNSETGNVVLTVRNNPMLSQLIGSLWTWESLDV